MNPNMMPHMMPHMTPVTQGYAPPFASPNAKRGAGEMGCGGASPGGALAGTMDKYPIESEGKKRYKAFMAGKGVTEDELIQYDDFVKAQRDRLIAEFKMDQQRKAKEASRSSEEPGGAMLPIMAGSGAVNDPAQAAAVLARAMTDAQHLQVPGVEGNAFSAQQFDRIKTAFHGITMHASTTRTSMDVAKAVVNARVPTKRIQEICKLWNVKGKVNQRSLEAMVVKVADTVAAS